MIKEPSLVTPDRLSTCLTLRTSKFGGFSDYFNFSRCLPNSCCFWKKRPCSLDCAVKFHVKTATFLRSKYTSFAAAQQTSTAKMLRFLKSFRKQCVF